MDRFTRTLTHATLAGIVLALAACAPRLVAVGPARGGLVTQTEDTAQVREALARALRARRYVIESEDETALVARLDNRGRTLRIRVDYDAQSYRIAYEGSSGLGYRVDPRTQEAMISAYYPRFVAQLDQTIQAELRRPAEEAREAEEARHEAVAAAAAAEREAELAAERRTARRERRERRRERWAEFAREQQETERERLRTQRAQAEADAERLRRQPPPVFVDHEPVYVERFAFDASRTRGQIRVRRGRTARTLRAHASGRFSSDQLGLPSACPGFWSGEPQHVVTVPHDMDYLRVEIAARADTTLAVVTPEGQVWCDDDSAGNQNPRLEGQFPAGTYAIYVGTYRRDDRTDYTLALDEERAQPAAVYAQRAPAPRRREPAPRRRAGNQVPDCRTSLLRAGHSATGLTYCRDAEPHCAAALFAAGHGPTALVYCRGVDPQCAVELLRAGQSPTGLTYCR